ncbi:MAG: CotH kinase family protein [Desulfoprunum sp.]|nr:CotH kinase family protein [Desulfoprunum sp.]
MGEILKQLGYFRLVDNDEKRFFRTDNESTGETEPLELIPFQKKRRVDEYLYKIDDRDPLQQFFPKGLSQKKNWPILAIKLSNEDLYDSKKGILTHRDKQGRDWERKAEILLIKEGEVLFHSSAGLRVHGGKRRIVKPFQSYRLHFRKKYGISSIPAGLVFENTGPVKTLVVQITDWPAGHPINNPLAYDVSAKMGCIVPETKLVEVYLNGVSAGMAYVTEHLSRRQFDQYFTQKDYLFYKYRGSFTAQDQRLFLRRFWVYANDRKEFSLNKVASSIDIDNFTRHVFSWVFNGATDACQGVGILDTANPDAKLRWINWDMDQSYWDFFAETYHIDRKNWQQTGLELIYKKGENYCDRSVLFTRLIKESREYREYYCTLFSEILNHRLTEDFLLERVNYYRDMLAAYGKPHEEYIEMLTDFMQNRAGFLRQEMVKQLHLAGPYNCTVQIPVGEELLIDGYSYKENYKGYYFEGQKVVLEPAKKHREGFSHWLIDGRKNVSPHLQHVFKNNTTIQAVYQEN